VPKAVFPVATVLAGVVNLVCALVPLLLIMVATGHPLRPSLALLPVAIVLAACLTLGVGLLLSPLAAFFTDTVEIVTILLTVLMYLTPVFYPVTIVPEDLRWVVEANPMHWVLDVFRLPIYDGVLPGVPTFALATIMAMLVLSIGAATFRATSHRIALYV
jgi:ABC-2 type transport system permease protein